MDMLGQGQSSFGMVSKDELNVLSASFGKKITQEDVCAAIGAGCHNFVLTSEQFAEMQKNNEFSKYAKETLKKREGQIEGTANEKDTTLVGNASKLSGLGKTLS